MGLCFALALAVPDVLTPGRQALVDLDYEAAVSELLPIADDERVAAPTRARAHMLIAEAHFGMAEPDAEDRAKRALRAALALDPRVDFEHEDDVSPRLVTLFEEMRPVARMPKTPPRDEPSSTLPSAAPADELPSKLPSQAPAEPLSAWWLASAGLTVTSLIAAGAAVGIDAYLGDLPPRIVREDVDAIQATGVAAVVVAIGAGAGALATLTAAMLE